jgi:glycine/D-amino acid oxidase-like deaminating enzyme
MRGLTGLFMLVVCSRCVFEGLADVLLGEADSTIPLPKTSDLVQCDEERCQDILDYVSSISTPLRTGAVLARQACYLPSVTMGGGPLIGETGIKGLLMATGHTCWGIQNSCATGKLISEFVFDGKAKSARIDSLDPRRVL